MGLLSFVEAILLLSQRKWRQHYISLSQTFSLSRSLFYTVLTSCKDNQVWPPDLYFMKPFPVSSSPQFHNRRKTAVLSQSGRKETERVNEEEGEREAGEWGLQLTASHLCSISKCLPGTVLFSCSQAQYMRIMS